MKIGSILSLLAVVLFGFGCAPQGTVAPASSVLTPEIETGTKAFALESLGVDDVATIQKALASGSELSHIVKSDAWKIPGGVDPMQISRGATFSSENAIFAFVEQPNQSNPLWLASGVSLFGRPGLESYPPVNFAGMLLSRDGGSTWRTVFSLPPVSPTGQNEGSLPPFNPVGMFVEKGLLWLDVVDASGAGSGEGTLVRYSSADGFAWKKADGCFYFITESYFDLSKLPETYTDYGNAPIRPHGVKAIDCPAYVSQLHS